MTAAPNPTSSDQVGEDRDISREVDRVITLDPSLKSVTYSPHSEILSPFNLLKIIFADFMEGRELAWRLFLRNLRGLYRQTALGLFWAFLPPLANTAIWIFLQRTGVFSAGEMGVHPAVFILTGMVLWQAFIDAFQMPLQAINKNRNMISKLNFPRESLLLVGLGEVAFNLLIRLLMLFPAFWLFGVSVGPSFLLGLVAAVGLILVGVSLGLLIMPIGFLYQDVGRFLQMVLPLWMILTPIIYCPLETFPGSLLNYLNPASPLLILGRDLMLFGGTEHWAIGLGFALFAIPIFLFGLVIHRVSMPVLVERMNA